MAVNTPIVKHASVTAANRRRRLTCSGGFVGPTVAVEGR